MVVRRTLIEPLSTATHVGVRARRRRVVQGPFGHQDPLTDGDRVATCGRAAADASRRVLTDDNEIRLSVAAARRATAAPITRPLLASKRAS